MDNSLVLTDQGRVEDDKRPGVSEQTENELPQAKEENFSSPKETVVDMDISEEQKDKSIQRSNDNRTPQKRKNESRNNNRGGRGKNKGSDGDRGKSNYKHLRQPNEGWEDQPPHEGSYAHPEMQKLFGIKVDQNLTPKTSSDATSTNEKQSDSENKTGNDQKSDSGDSTVVKYPKRKVALFVSFLGSAYCGMQINNNQRTIQAEIELALFRAGFLTRTNFGYPQKYSWSNSARTDKGVHSCAQVCSVKLQLPTENMDIIREKINEKLPEDIRVLDIVKTTQKFCAKTARDKVRYQYMFPSFLLYDRQPLREIFQKHNCHFDNNRPFSDSLSPDEIKLLYPILIQYRSPPEKLQKLKQALTLFEGTHSFHNYTNRKTSADPSSKRYIMSFTLQDPIIASDGTEWIQTQVVGQSFLLHQIRKMISMATEVARDAVDLDVMRDSFTERQMKLSIAPAHGLFLDMSYFDIYNKRKKSSDDLNWATEGTPGFLRWKEFKEKVMTHIMEEETKQHNFVKYIFSQEFFFEDHYMPLKDDVNAKRDEEPSPKADEKMEEDG